MSAMKRDRKKYERDLKRRQQKIIGSRYRAYQRWHAMNQRVSKFAAYSGVEIRVAKEDFIQWFMPLDFEGSSVDRIDPKGHYEFSNMRVISKSENSRRAHLTFTDTHGKCRCCGLVKRIDEFCKNNQLSNGRKTLCKACDAINARQRMAKKRKDSK